MAIINDYYNRGKSEKETAIYYINNRLNKMTFEELNQVTIILDNLNTIIGIADLIKDMDIFKRLEGGE